MHGVSNIRPVGQTQSPETISHSNWVLSFFENLKILHVFSSVTANEFVRRECLFLPIICFMVSFPP